MAIALQCIGFEWYRVDWQGIMVRIVEGVQNHSIVWVCLFSFRFTCFPSWRDGKLGLDGRVGELLRLAAAAQQQQLAISLYYQQMLGLVKAACLNQFVESYWWNILRTCLWKWYLWFESKQNYSAVRTANRFCKKPDISPNTQFPSCRTAFEHGIDMYFLIISDTYYTYSMFIPLNGLFFPPTL